MRRLFGNVRSQFELSSASEMCAGLRPLPLPISLVPARIVELSVWVQHEEPVPVPREDAVVPNRQHDFYWRHLRYRAPSHPSAAIGRPAAHAGGAWTIARKSSNAPEPPGTLSP